MDVTHPAFAFGAQAVLGTDATGEYVYHYASPQNPTQLYLYRTSLETPGCDDARHAGRPAGHALVLHLA